jgi:hypothetical protein
LCVFNSVLYDFDRKKIVLYEFYELAQIEMESFLKRNTNFSWQKRATKEAPFMT